MTLVEAPPVALIRERAARAAGETRASAALPYPPLDGGGSAVPQVSVVVPAHDAARHLPRALRSVLSQSVTDIEVIVVDDASRDRTAERVEEIGLRDPRVRLIRSRRNLGPGGARNLALEAAHAPWVALLDSDDSYLPGRLSRLLRYARRTGADLVADNLILKDERDPRAGRPMLPATLLDQPRWLDAEAFVKGNLPIVGQPRVSLGFLKPVIRRAFLERHDLEYRRGLRFAEDFDFYLRCLLAGGRWLLIPEAGYAYRVRGESLTARHGAGELARLRALDRQHLASRSSPDTEPALDAALGAHLRSVEDRLVWRLVLTSLGRGRLRRAARLALRSRHDLHHVALSLLRELPRQITLRLHRQRGRQQVNH